MTMMMCERVENWKGIPFPLLNCGILASFSVKRIFLIKMSMQYGVNVEQKKPFFNKQHRWKRNVREIS